MKLCTVPLFVFGLLAQVIVYGALGFLSPTLSLHLLTYDGYDEFWIGVYFCVPAIIYILNTPLVSVYCKILNRRAVVFLGMCLFCFAIALIGTSPILGIPNLGKVIFMGLCILGFAAAMIVIPIFPEMLDSIEKKYPELKGDDLSNISAGFFNSFLGVGEALGPVSASLMAEYFGFRNSEDVVAGLILVYCVAFFLLGGRLDMFKTSKIEIADLTEA